MPDHTIQEAEETILKAGVYFGRVLEEHKQAFLAVNVEGVTIVVAHGVFGKKLEKLLTGGAIKTAEPVVIPHVKKPKPPPEPINVKLIPRYHAPGEQWSNKLGSIHLHVLRDVTMGRRVRKQGECLCGKKRGSRERMPDGETNMCSECVKVAAEHGIEWSL